MVTLTMSGVQESQGGSLAWTATAHDLFCDEYGTQGLGPTHEMYAVGKVTNGTEGIGIARLTPEGNVTVFADVTFGLFRPLVYLSSTPFTWTYEIAGRVPKA